MSGNLLDAMEDKGHPVMRKKSSSIIMHVAKNKKKPVLSKKSTDALVKIFAISDVEKKESSKMLTKLDKVADDSEYDSEEVMDDVV